MLGGTAVLGDSSWSGCPMSRGWCPGRNQGGCEELGDTDIFALAEAVFSPVGRKQPV